MAFIYQVLRVVVLGVIAAAVDGLCISYIHVVSRQCLQRWTHALGRLGRLSLGSNTGLTYEASIRNYDRQHKDKNKLQTLETKRTTIGYVPITWSPTPRAAYLPCLVAGAARIQLRRPPPLNPDDDSVLTQPKFRYFIWKRGADEINQKRIFENGTLEVTRRHGGSSEGVYQCMVQNHGNVLGYPVNLKFSYMNKTFFEQPQNVTPSLGQPLKIPCRIGSGPNALISWTRDGADLPPNNRYHLLDSELLITDVKTDDAGSYRCTATNSNANTSRISSEGRVVVKESSASEPSLLVTHHAADVAVPRESRVVLPCPVMGWPRPKLIWELTPPQGGRKSELESTEEVLVLSKLGEDQEGMYTCTVEGRSDLTKRFNVTITEPVNITHPPEPKEALRASTVRFNCVATGRPAPTITWYKDGSLLQLAGRIYLRTSADRERIELVISGVTSDDAGVYQCFASNGVSTSSEWAKLNVSGAGAPPPSDVKCAPTDVSSVELRWKPAAANVTSIYTVNSTPIGNGEFKTSLPIEDTVGIVKPKEPLTPYVFQVRAFYQLPNKQSSVASDFSESIICQGQGVPIQLIKQEDDKVKVSWQQFSEENPGVVQWILQYKSVMYNGIDDEHNVTLAPNTTEYTLTAPKSSPLLVRLLGSRTLKWLHQNLTLVPWHSTNTNEQDADDGVVKPVEELQVTDVKDRSFTVTWHYENANKYTFMVCWRKVDSNDVCLESFRTNTTIEGLQPDSEYEVRVQARLPDKVLGGAFSPFHRVITQPEEAKYLNHQYTSAGVTVWWSEPGFRTVWYTQNLTQPLDSWNSVNVSFPKIELTKLNKSLPVYVIVSSGGGRKQQVLTIPARPMLPPASDDSYYYYYIGFGVGCGVCALCAIAGGAFCCWRRVKANRAPVRSRRAQVVSEEGEEDCSEMKEARRARVANGGAGGGMGAGEPLLNGHVHVHITENPAPITPNGRMKKGRRHEHTPQPHTFEAFDLSRNEHDTTMETVLEDTTFNLLDTSRRPEFDLSRSSHNLSANNSFNKLPDDNMNSELTRSTEFQLDNSKIQPTLQPNG